MRFLSLYRAQGPLSHLSLTRDGKNLTNAERLRLYRECVPPSLHNPFPWPYLQPKQLAGKVIRFRKRA